MKEAEFYDIVDRFRNMKTREEDGVIRGQALDLSPARTCALAKSFVRPRRGSTTTASAQTTHPERQATAGHSRSANPVSARKRATVESAAESAVVQPPHACSIAVQDVKECLTSDPAQYVGENRRNRILKSCYTVGSVTNPEGKNCNLKSFLFDCGSTLDLVNEGVAKTLGLKLVSTKPRPLSVADGYQVIVTGRTWGTLTLEGRITKHVPVLVVTRDTPYSLLLGTWGLFVLHAEAVFHPLPTAWTIGDTAAGPRVAVTRDNDKELQEDIRMADESEERRHEALPLQDIPVNRLRNKNVRFAAAVSAKDTESSSAESENVYI